MKIAGFCSGHDAAYGILKDGVPEIHNELERFNRIKDAEGVRGKIHIKHHLKNVRLLVKNGFNQDITNHTQLMLFIVVISKRL